MIAVDTNILVYSVRDESPWHRQALRRIRELAEGDRPWAIPWPCLHEFAAVVTHPKIYKPPMTLADALTQIDNWRASPTLHLLGEGRFYWDRFRPLAIDGKVAGPLVHDARVAAICIAAGVQELWSVDRDFTRFRPLRVRNPL